MAATPQEISIGPSLSWPLMWPFPTHDIGDIVVSRAFGMDLMTSMAVQPTSLWTRKRCFTLYAHMCSSQIDISKNTVSLKDEIS